MFYQAIPTYVYLINHPPTPLFQITHVLKINIEDKGILVTEARSKALPHFETNQQRPKNHSVIVALPSRKFLHVQKVFAHIPWKFPAWMVCKVYEWSGMIPEWVFMVSGRFSWFLRVPSWFFMVPDWFSWVFMIPGWFFIVPGWFFTVPGCFFVVQG